MRGSLVGCLLGQGLKISWRFKAAVRVDCLILDLVMFGYGGFSDIYIRVRED